MNAIANASGPVAQRIGPRTQIKALKFKCAEESPRKPAGNAFFHDAGSDA